MSLLIPSLLDPHMTESGLSRLSVLLSAYCTDVQPCSVAYTAELRPLRLQPRLRLWLRITSKRALQLILLVAVVATSLAAAIAACARRCLQWRRSESGSIKSS